MPRVRPVAVADHPFLSRELPELLPGQWSPAALAASPYRQWVLVDGQSDAILGFAEAMQVLDEGELLGIAVWPQWQGRGFGALLLREVLRQMHALGCARCHLEVRRSNAVARRLYDNAGFGEVGVRKGYYPSGNGQSEDAVLYSVCLVGE